MNRENFEKFLLFIPDVHCMCWQIYVEKFEKFEEKFQLEVCFSLFCLEDIEAHSVFKT